MGQRSPKILKAHCHTSIVIVQRVCNLRTRCHFPAATRAEMAPKRSKSPPSDPHGMFSQMAVFLIETGVKAAQLQIWKQKLMQMGAKIEDRLSKKVTHIFAADFNSLRRKIDQERLNRFEGKVVNYQWLENSLRIGEKVPEDAYVLSAGMGGNVRSNNREENHMKVSHFREDNASQQKKLKTSVGSEESNEVSENAHHHSSKSDIASGSPGSSRSLSPEVTSPTDYDQNKDVSTSEASLLYNPPDLNKNITDIFKKLVDIYRALGDDRRSFSYHKAIPVIEKLPFTIVSADQVKHQPGIGKSLQDHVQEIVNTGKLSKLEHFEKDEKVRTISLFGEVWGIGPTTASKLYEKGHRTLDDLRNEESLTNTQMIGLKYFDDIKTRIPRQEVQEMENLLQKVGEEISPGAATLYHSNLNVNLSIVWSCYWSFRGDDCLRIMYSVGRVEIVCGGSYRRGKASCGDLDIIVTHPDGKSHIGFLPKFVRRLKDINFLREDLVFSVHSDEGTDSGVDTYFGLCTYPGRELRHRIDFKVFPRDIYAFGLIAWTGNDVLNRRLRLLAETKGFKLDDTGLFPATQSSGGKRGSKGSASLKFATEKQVFDFLEFPWLEPYERNL